MAHERIPSSPPAILPPGNNSPRPFWSVMIPVYNNIQYLEQTLGSVLAQAPPSTDMQIEVVDDASTDGNVEALVLKMGNGRVTYFRQPHNVGSLRNFETCINRAQGRVIHLLHGDDLVLPGYYAAINKLFDTYPDAGAAFCRFEDVNEKGEVIRRQAQESTEPGILKDWLLHIAKYNRIQYAAITVKREVYERLGGFYGIDYGEDWEMWARIAANYPVAYTPEVLASYRKHLQSITGKKIRSGAYIDDLVTAMYMIQRLLPPPSRKETLSYSKKYYSRYALKTATGLWNATHKKTYTWHSIRKALMLNRDFRTILNTTRLFIRMFLRRGA